MTGARRRLLALLAALVALAAAAPADAGAAPRRVVALTPFTANTLADLRIRPVAVGRVLGGNERFSRRLRGVRRLPLAHPSGPNLEQLARLRPDLVLSTQTWRKGHQAMRRLGIRVAESDPQSVPEILGETRRIGRLVGKRREAERLARRLYETTRRELRDIRSRPRVLMILGVGRTPFAFLPNSWGGDLVRRAGGQLLTEGLEASGGFARISNEYVVAVNPEVIIAVPHGNPEDIPGIVDYMRNNPAWENTDAVRSGRLYVSTDNSLLQAGTDVARTIRRVRAWYLQNR